MLSVEKDALGCIYISINNSSYFFQDRAEKPEITFTGNMKVGQTVTVMCSVYHTCRTLPPILRLNIPTQGNQPTHYSMSDGTTKTTLMTTMNIKNDLQEVECTVYHTGGVTEKASRTFKAECMWWVCKNKTKFLLCRIFLSLHLPFFFLRLVFTLDHSTYIPRIPWGPSKQSYLHCPVHMPKTFAKIHMELWGHDRLHWNHKNWGCSVEDCLHTDTDNIS